MESLGFPPADGIRLAEGQSWAIASPPPAKCCPLHAPCGEKAVADKFGFGQVVDNLQLAVCTMFLKTYKYQLLKIFH